MSTRFAKQIPIIFLLVFALLHGVAAAFAEEEYLGKDKIQELVEYFRGQAELARTVQGWTSAEHYVSAHDSEYYENLAQIFEQNAARLQARERVRQQVLTDYFATIDEDIKAFAWMPELKKRIAYHLKLLKTPGIDQLRVEEFYRRGRINGEDQQVFYERIARYSRPQPLELDEIELVISGGEQIDPKRDYWIDHSAQVEFTVTNHGQDDAEGVEFELQTSPPILEGLLGNGFRCNSIDVRQGAGACQLEILQASASASVQTEFRTRIDTSGLASDRRTRIGLSVRASSHLPSFETQKRFGITLRACVSAYDDALAPPLQEFSRRLGDATAPNSKLPGRAIYTLPADKQYLTSQRDDGLNGKVHALIAFLQINKGIDSDLKWLDLSYGPYATIKTVALQLPRTLIERSEPGRHCQSPQAELVSLRANILPALRARADEVRHYHRLLVLAANQRMQALQFALEVGQQGTAEGETLEGATQELAFQTLETGLKKLAPYSDDLATFLRMNALARTVGRGSNLLSFIEIFRATRAFFYVLPEWWEPEHSLAMLEALPYVAALAERYEALADALESYLDAIEAAYTASCTCHVPFEQ